MGRPKKYGTEAERKAARVQDTLRHRDEHRDKVNEYRRKYASEHPEKIREYNQKHYYKNQTLHLEYHADYRKNLKEEMLSAYGGRCKCCGESTPEFLTVDHIYGYKNRPDLYAHSRRGGAALYMWLRKNNWPKDGFELLCFNCNLGRAKQSDGICPHQKMKFNIAGLAC